MGLSSYGSGDNAAAPLAAVVVNPPEPQERAVEAVARPLLAAGNLRLSEMNDTQKKNYARAMACRAAKKGVQKFTEWARTSLGTLSGVELSGFLNCQTETATKNWLSTYIHDDKGESIDFNDFITVAPHPVSLETSLDGYLTFPIRTLTYASAVAWFVGHSLTPPIERYLSAKEDTFMRRVIANQDELDEQLVAPPSTWASKLSYLIEYIMPVLFDGTQTALFLRLLRNVGSELNFWPGGPEINLDLSDGGLTFTALFAVWEVMLKMLPGEDPISTTALYLLCATGIALYLSQAWCNFEHDFKQKEAAPRVEELPLV